VAERRSHEYRVERDIWGQERAEISLIRQTVSHGLLKRLRDHGSDDVVVFHRTFKPRLELDQLERYARELERAAKHGNEGTLGCFVDTQGGDGVVEVKLYERWFDGRRLICDELASRRFDPEEDTTLVASTEFLAELQEWAERRNDEREAAYLESSVEDAVREQRSVERASAASELASILAKHSS
jgi:hypothetical protein